MTEKVSTDLYAAFTVLAGRGDILTLLMNKQGFSTIPYPEYRAATERVQESGLRTGRFADAVEVIAFKKPTEAEVAGGIVQGVDNAVPLSYGREQEQVVEYRLVASFPAAEGREAQRFYNFGSGPAYRNMSLKQA